MDDEDFLAAIEADNASMTVTEEPKAKEPAEPTPEPAPEAETPPTPAEPVLELTELAPEQTKPTEGFVPLGAVLDERDKRKAAEARLAQFEAQQAKQPVQMPDPYDDPEGFAAAQQGQTAAALYQINMRYSERLAKIEHGAETVDAAKAWAMAKCDADPLFNAKIAQSDDPVGLAVTEYRRDEIASKVTPDDFKAFQAWKEAQGQLQPASAVPPNSPPAIPSRSLASAPSAGNILTEIEPSEEDIFGAAIPKR